MMRDQLEAALTRTLSDAAETAPVWLPNLMHEVEERHRVRRRRRYVTVSGIAAFTVIMGSALVSGALNGSDTPTGPDVIGVPAAPPIKEPPVAKMWPEAYHKLPSKLADGRTYRVWDMIDDHRVLISTEAVTGLNDELWALDMTTRTAHRLVQLPKPDRHGREKPSHFTIGFEHIVWWDSYEADGKLYRRIWKAPVTGGEPVLLSTVSERYGSPTVRDRLAVHDDTVYFSHSRDRRGVRTVPLAGGEAAWVPDTKGYHILQWPWITSPGTCHDGSCEVRPHTQRFFTELKHAETGEERSANLPEGMTAICSLTYCVGLLDRKPMATTRDGSKQIRLPRPPHSLHRPPAWDRFAVLHDEVAPLAQLYDLKTGESAGMGRYGGRIGDQRRRSLVWSTDEYGTTYHLLDLAAIK